MYLLFAYDTYYPKGGSDDFVGVYTQEGISVRVEEIWDHFDCIQYYDTSRSRWEYAKYSKKLSCGEVI